MPGMDLIQLQDKIARMCSSLVARVNDHTKRLDRWPEELSQLNQVVAVVNELDRVVIKLRESANAGQEEAQQDKTQQILARAFEDVLGNVALGSPRGPEDEDAVDPFTFDGRIFSVREILNFLADSQRSGQVEVRGSTETYFLHLDQGTLVGAYSNNSPAGCRLGEILTEEFQVDPEVLEKFLSGGRQGVLPLGQALAEQAVVPRDIVYDALCFQIEKMFERCLSEERADVIYDPGCKADLADGPTLRFADILLNVPDPR